MFLALEEAPFVLQGPKPTIPPAAWESYWALGLIALGLIALGVVALRQFLRKGPPSLAPLAQLDVALRLAEAEPAPAAIAKATRALRVYLAGIREAAKRIEDAQRTFARPVTAPVVPPKPRPAALDVPPPLPGPPPLPRRDHA